MDLRVGRGRLPAVASLSAALLLIPVLVLAWQTRDRSGGGQTTGTTAAPVPAVMWDNGPCGRVFAAPRATAPPPVTKATTPGPYTMRAGWVWHREPSGLRIAAPVGAVYAAREGTICFRERPGARVVGVDTAWPAGDLLATLRTREKALEQELPGYSRVGLRPASYLGGAADLEFTFESSTGDRLHGLLRAFHYGDGGARTAAIIWVTRDLDWLGDQGFLRTVMLSFRPPERDQDPAELQGGSVVPPQLTGTPTPTPSPAANTGIDEGAVEAGLPTDEPTEATEASEGTVDTGSGSQNGNGNGNGSGNGAGNGAGNGNNNGTGNPGTGQGNHP
ncbi:hypothetical protein ACFQX7_12045 [Luedemannella flava]